MRDGFATISASTVSERVPVITVGHVRVVVGPVPTASAEAWIGYAREVLDRLSEPDCNRPCSAEVLAMFGAWLTEWERACESTARFLWEQEISVEVLEYHVHAFHQIAQQLEAEARRTGPRAPAEATPFYTSLVHGVLEALADDGGPAVGFATHLADFWPGQRSRV